MDVFRDSSVRKPKPNISMGQSRKPVQKMSDMGFSELEASILSFVDDKVERRYPEIRFKSKNEGVNSLYNPRDSLKPVAAKIMPSTLPPLKFPKIEAEIIRRYYIEDLITALDD